MEVLKIVINSEEDAKAGRGICEGLTKDQIIETKDLTIGILENGTSLGQPVVMFVLRQPDGTAHVAQITANHFVSLVQVYNAAVTKFEANKVSKN